MQGGTEFKELRTGTDRDIANAVRMLVGIMPPPISRNDWTKAEEIAAQIRVVLKVDLYTGKAG